MPKGIKEFTVCWTDDGNVAIYLRKTAEMLGRRAQVTPAEARALARSLDMAADAAERAPEVVEQERLCFEGQEGT